MVPGCKADVALVVYGKQGMQKSSFFNVLASDAFFTGARIDVTNEKEAGIVPAGKWIKEFPELAGPQADGLPVGLEG